MVQRWPVRRGRPYREKLPPETPLATGQRVIDTLFPLAKGGTAAVPGPFGSGKTVVQHQLAKWADVDIVVYIGCGERGNEMTDVLREFPELTDPRTGRSLMERTVSIANTSDMPVAARGSQARTPALPLRSISGIWAMTWPSLPTPLPVGPKRCGRCPGGWQKRPVRRAIPPIPLPGWPKLYERAGVVETFGQRTCRGSLTAVGAVSPPGGDLSEPVAQGTMRIVKVFWALDAQLAYRRHFPAINWLNSDLDSTARRSRPGIGRT